MRLPGRKSGEAEPARVPRKDRSGASPFAVGLLALVVIALVTYLGFSKHVPFTHGFRVRAVFQSANSIRTNSPVRIAGVNVGKVKAIARQPGSDTSIVTMEIQGKGLIPAIYNRQCIEDSNGTRLAGAGYGVRFGDDKLDVS